MTCSRCSSVGLDLRSVSFARGYFWLRRCWCPPMMLTVSKLAIFPRAAFIPVPLTGSPLGLAAAGPRLSTGRGAGPQQNAMSPVTLKPSWFLAQFRFYAPPSCQRTSCGRTVIRHLTTAASRPLKTVIGSFAGAP